MKEVERDDLELVKTVVCNDGCCTISVFTEERSTWLVAATNDGRSYTQADLTTAGANTLIKPLQSLSAATAVSLCNDHVVCCTVGIDRLPNGEVELSLGAQAWTYVT